MGYLRRTFSAFGVRDYRLYAIGQIISVCGTWMQKLAQAWLVLVLTHSGLLLGVTTALQQLPTMLFTTYGGVLADRYDKKRILICTSIAGAIPALFLGIVVKTGSVQVWMVMVAALAQGLVDAVDKPARLTAVNDIAGPEVLTNAIALNSVIQNAGKVVGPGIAGILIGTVGISVAFLVNAVSYLPVIIALVMIRTRMPVHSRLKVSTRGSTRETLRYVAARPDLAAALGLMFVAGLLAYNWNVILPTLMLDSFHGDAKTAGFAFTAMGIGGVVGGLVLAGLIRPTTAGLMVNGWVFAVVLILLSAAPWLSLAEVLLVVLGVASVTFRASATSILQVNSDPKMRGRVISLLVLCLNGTTPIGGPLVGYICQVFSPRVAFALAGVATAVAATVAMRHLRLTHRTAADGLVAS